MFDNYGNHPAQPAPPAPTSTRIVRFDKEYFTTTPGILKLVQLICNVIGFICLKFSLTQYLSAIFYNIMYWVGITVTLFLVIMYMFHFVEKFSRLPWAKYECFFCALMTLTYLGCSIFALVINESIGYAIGFFGFCAITAYGLDGYYKYKAWRSGLPAQ